MQLCQNFSPFKKYAPCIDIPYGRKLWQGETLVNRPWFAKVKPVLIINNLLADLLIHQMLETSQSAKISPHQTFPPYRNQNVYFSYNISRKLLHSITIFLWKKKEIFIIWSLSLNFKTKFLLIHVHVYFL